MKNLSILGSTGSIGQSALSLVDLYPERFRVVGLAAGSRVDELERQARKYKPQVVAASDECACGRLRESLPGTEVVCGQQGVVGVAVMDEADVVVAGISGSAGLLPVYRAVERGKTVALANKETLVMAGHLILRLAEKNGSAILPVDSEHSALHQCLRGSKPTELKRLWLTASGGPFLNHTSAQMKSVSVEEALSHPTWDMGPKISVDSATMMNKGLEVIEAHHLFGVPGDQISVVIHPQSVVHSMVEFVDGNILAQMSITDMRSAILYALSYPDRWQSNLPKLDLFETSSLEFHPPDLERFPCVSLAYEALRNGETYPIALNSANEVAVDAFLKGNLPFHFIPKVIEEILVGHVPVSAADVETVMEVDRQSREESGRLVLSLT